jgi:raffinose/stachyose/melibiose transport system substrate-binding protein
MREKRILSMVLALVLLLTLLTGCSAKTDDNQGVDQTPTDKAGNESKNDDGNVVLKLFGFTPGYSEVLPAIIEDYYNETGVTVEIETGGEDYYTVLKTRFVGGEAPDIFDLESAYFSSWSDRCADLSQCDFVNHAFQSSLEPAKVNGEIIGFPYAFEGSGIIYNKDIFEDAGVEVPTTLSELKDVCAKLKDAGYQAFGEAWGEWGFLMHIFGTTFAYEGDCKVLADKLNSGEMKLNDLKYMDNFFELYDLTLDYGLGKESIGYGYASQAPDFASGKMAMIKQGTWLYSMITAANPDINMGLMAVPLNDNPEDTKLMTSASRYFAVNKESENYEEACKFLDWFCDNIQKYIVDPMGVMAPYDTVNTSQLTALNSDMFSYAEKNMTYSSFGTDYWPAGFNIDVATPLQAYAAGSMTKEDVIAELQTLYNNRVKSSE